MSCAICGRPTAGATFCDACLARLDGLGDDETATIREPSGPEAPLREPRAETRSEPLEGEAGLDPAEQGPIEDLESAGGRTDVWAPDVALFSGEAVILGEPFGEDEGAGPPARGTSLAGFAYTNEGSLRLLAPGSIPVATAEASPQSPFEEFLLRRIDGRRTVADLGRSGALSADEISVGLLSLLERGALRVEPPSTEVSGDVSRAEEDIPITEAALEDSDEEFDEDEETATLREGATIPKPAGPLPERLPSAFMSPLDEPPARLPSVFMTPIAEPQAPPPRLPSIFLSPVSPSSEARRASVRSQSEVRSDPRAPPERMPSLLQLALPEVAPSAEVSRRKQRDARRIRLARREARRFAKLDVLRERAAVLAAVAERELANGNIVGARLSLKIAVAIDPSELLTRRLELASKVKPAVRVEDPELRTDFEEALRAEARGHLDTAIVHLEKALEKRRDPVVLNRLGVILATQKRSLRRARDLLEEAVRLVPGNPTYGHNLEKVERLMAPRRETPAKAPEPKGLLRRWFGRG